MCQVLDQASTRALWIVGDYLMVGTGVQGETGVYLSVQSRWEDSGGLG